MSPIPVMVVGGAGYVAGELLRLLAAHPGFQLEAVIAARHPGGELVQAFPQLRGSLSLTHFEGQTRLEQALQAGRPLGLFFAGPHGTSAASIGSVLELAKQAGAEVRVVDLSADFRHADAETYAHIYGQPHGAPEWLPHFTCSVPELYRGAPEGHVAHAGCFTTAVTLGLAPLLASGWVKGRVFVSAVTGSTGAGKTPSAGTHHPERHDNLYGYQPLVHRHVPEMVHILEQATGVRCALNFVPHSGPFARGIYATIQAELTEAVSPATLLDGYRRFYAHAPLVHVGLEPPRLREVVGTQRAVLGVSVQGQSAVIFSTLDNLVKGAAGSGIQWMNRLWGLPETLGLPVAGIGWA